MTSKVLQLKLGVFLLPIRPHFFVNPVGTIDLIIQDILKISLIYYLFWKLFQNLTPFSSHIQDRNSEASCPALTSSRVEAGSGPSPSETVLGAAARSALESLPSNSVVPLLIHFGLLHTPGSSQVLVGPTAHL